MSGRPFWVVLCRSNRLQGSAPPSLREFRKTKPMQGRIRNMTDGLRVLLAEDHETVRAGIRILIDSQADMTVVGEAQNGEAAIQKAAELVPDVIVMDISMPQLNGLVATKRIKQVAPQIKILTLTRHTDDGYLQQLIQAGANGYVLKQSAPSELVKAIRAVCSG